MRLDHFYIFGLILLKLLLSLSQSAQKLQVLCHKKSAYFENPLCVKVQVIYKQFSDYCNKTQLPWLHTEKIFNFIANKGCFSKK